MNTKNLLLALLAIMFAVMIIPAGSVEIRGTPFDQGSAIYNQTISWSAETFAGFWYIPAIGVSSETLRIDQLATSLTVGGTIGQGNLLYNSNVTTAKYRVFLETGKTLENGVNSYQRLGWFGSPYVAINGKTTKLVKVVKEQWREEVQILKLGEGWNLGEGYVLSLEAIDGKVSPRQAWLVLSKDGKTLDNKIVNEKEVYSYAQNFAGESGVPVFVTYVASIFAGRNESVQLRYTWFLSQNITEIKVGDSFGALEVIEADKKHLFLQNKAAITLSQNTVQALYGDLKLRIADSAPILRFYPITEKKDPIITQVQQPIIASITNTSITCNNTAQVVPVEQKATFSTSPSVSTETPVLSEKTFFQKILGFWGTYIISAMLILSILIFRPGKK